MPGAPGGRCSDPAGGSTRSAFLRSRPAYSLLIGEFVAIDNEGRR
jgi:hypothetical protein